MKRYQVTWTIDIEENSHKDAAEKAFEIMQREGTTATVFDVLEVETSILKQIDLLEENID